MLSMLIRSVTNLKTGWTQTKICLHILNTAIKSRKGEKQWVKRN